MMSRYGKWAAVAATFIVMALVSCSSMPPRFTVPSEHPEELDKGRAICTDCHDQSGDIPYASYNHQGNWERGHRNRVYGQEQVCTMCHRESFCNDCHATSVELKPSVRRQSQTYRNMPHRGDYISRHRIDARIDPTSCYRCHGTPKTAKRCAPCHG